MTYWWRRTRRAQRLPAVRVVCGLRKRAFSAAFEAAEAPGSADSDVTSVASEDAVDYDLSAAAPSPPPDASKKNSRAVPKQGTPGKFDEAGDFEEEGDFDGADLDEPARVQASSDEEGDFDDEPAPKPAAVPAAAARLLDTDFGDDDDDDDDGDFDTDDDDDDDMDWLADVVEACPSHFEGGAHRRVGLAYSSEMARHEDTASDHPERPERITMAYSELSRCGLVEKCTLLRPRRARGFELRRGHDKQFVAAALQLRRRCRLVVSAHSDPAAPERHELRAQLRELGRRHDSVYLNEFSVDCALLSAAGAIDAVEAVFGGPDGCVSENCDHAAALVRPPGHHAECHCMMGFCVFNNVVLAAHAALARGARRILIVDWDVHHGNGTQRAFLDDPRVLFVSLHRYEHGAFYPCSRDAAPDAVGDGAGAGFTANVAWNGGRGAGDADYEWAFRSVVLPLARAFAPEVTLVSAGFDSARGDPLGGCDVTPKCYARLTHALVGAVGRDEARTRAKVVLCLEGGYNCVSVAKSFSACVGALLGADPPDGEPCEPCQPEHVLAVGRTALALAPYWPQLKKPLTRAIAAAKKARKHLIHQAKAAPSASP